jgi:rhamnosyltransferase subunit B
VAGSRSSFVLFPIGSTGDVNPFAAIGGALLKRGHRVVLVTNSYFENVALRNGLEFVSTGPAKAYVEMIRSSDVPAGKRLKLIFQRVLERMESTYRLIESNFSSAETVLIAPPLAFGARLAQEKLGLPLVTLNVETTNFRSSYAPERAQTPRFLRPIVRYWRGTLLRAMDDWLLDPILLPRLNAFRAELGLAPISYAWRDWPHSPLLTIGLFPEWFAPRQPDWPPQARLTGFPLLDDRDLQPEVLRFLEAGEPPIAFTLGTGAHFAKKFFEISAQACVKLRRRGMFLTRFGEWLPAKLPEGVIHFEYVPLSAVLVKLAALVHHGGIGTMAYSLRAGVPQLITPIFFDQPANAARLAQLGAGETIQPRHYSVDNVARALSRLLTSPQIRARCREIAGRFEGSDTIEDICRLIESVHGQPVERASAATQ